MIATLKKELSSINWKPNKVKTQMQTILSLLDISQNSFELLGFFLCRVVMPFLLLFLSTLFIFLQ